MGYWDITLTRLTSRGTGKVRLHEGRIDDDAMDYFGHAYCHWLAGAISVKTGWDVVTLDRHENGRWVPVHSATRTPQGRVVDIFGTHADLAALERKYAQLGGFKVRHRVVPVADMPGDVLTNCEDQRGDPRWWAHETTDKRSDIIEHFADVVIEQHRGLPGAHIPAPRPPLPPPHEPSPAAQEGPRPGVVTVDGFGRTCRRKWTKVAVEPDRITDDARELFGHRHCVLLGVEIHRQTGWPLAVVDMFQPGEGWSWAHVVCRRPDGLLVDIDGARTDRDLIDDRTRDGYELPMRVRDIGDETELQQALGVAERGEDWHLKSARFGADYQENVLRRMATTVIRDHSGPAPGASAPSSTHHTAPGGTAMSGIEEIRGTLSRATEETEQAQHALAEAMQRIESARAAVAQAALSSSRDEIQQALAAYGHVGDSLREVGGRMAVSVDQVRTYAAQL